MDYSLIKEFLANYSLQTAIITITVTIFCLVMEKIFKNKLPVFFKAQLPFITAVTVNFLIDMIFVSNAFVLKKQTLFSGILCGTLAVILKNAFINAKNGKTCLSSGVKIMIIEELLKEIVPKEALRATAIAIQSIFDDQDFDDNNANLKNNINQVINSNSTEELSEENLGALTLLIIESLNSIVN